MPRLEETKNDFSQIAGALLEEDSGMSAEFANPNASF